MPIVMWLQDILIGNGKLTGPHSVKYDLPGRVDVGGTVTARDVIIASGSVPFVPPGGRFLNCTKSSCNNIRLCFRCPCLVREGTVLIPVPIWCLLVQDTAGADTHT